MITEEIKVKKHKLSGLNYLNIDGNKIYLAILKKTYGSEMVRKGSKQIRGLPKIFFALENNLLVSKYYTT